MIELQPRHLLFCWPLLLLLYTEGDDHYEVDFHLLVILQDTGVIQYLCGQEKIGRWSVEGPLRSHEINGLPSLKSQYTKLSKVLKKRLRLSEQELKF